jgi:hypothetical protein
VAHGAFEEVAVLRDPVDGLGVGFLRVGALTLGARGGVPAARVHQRVEALGEFVLVIMRVAVEAQVEVALRLPRCAPFVTTCVLTEWRVVALHLHLALPPTISCKCCTAISGRR